MVRPLSICIAKLSLLFVGFHPCLADSPEDRNLEALDALMSNYHREIEEEVERVYEAEVADLQKYYMEALRRSLQPTQQEGNLESSLAFSNEINRIESGQPEAESEASESPPAQLINLRQVYDLNLRMIEQQRDQRRAPISRKMFERMTELQEELTRAGRLEDALHVKKKRESLLASDSPSLPEPAETPEPNEASRMAAKPDTPEPDGELLEWLQSHELFWAATNANEVALRFDGRMVQVFTDGRQIMENEIAIHGKNRFSFQWGSRGENTFELSRNRNSFTRSMATGTPHSGEVRKISE